MDAGSRRASAAHRSPPSGSAPGVASQLGAVNATIRCDTPTHTACRSQSAHRTTHPTDPQRSRTRTRIARHDPTQSTEIAGPTEETGRSLHEWRPACPPPLEVGGIPCPSRSRRTSRRTEAAREERYSRWRAKMAHATHYVAGLGAAVSAALAGYLANIDGATYWAIVVGGVAAALAAIVTFMNPRSRAAFPVQPECRLRVAQTRCSVGVEPIRRPS